MPDSHALVLFRCPECGTPFAVAPALLAGWTDTDGKKSVMLAPTCAAGHDEVEMVRDAR